MVYDNKTQPYVRPSSVIPVVFFTSLVTSVIVTITTLWLTGNLQSLKGEPAPAPTAKLLKVPPLIGLTTDMAGEVLRSRDLRLVVQGQQPDAKIAEGKIAAQDPLADSELNAGGAVNVTISSGVKKLEVPQVIGKPLEEAKTLITSKGLVVGQVLDTGKGDPGTVTETSPKPGTVLNEGEEVTLTISPAGIPVPDLVGSLIGKAKKMLEEAGFKPGKTKWRYDEYRNPSSVLSQEPAAGASAPPGSTVDLVVNEAD